MIENTRGHVFLLSIGVLAVSILLAGSLTGIITRDHKMTSLNYRQLQAYYQAEAGLEHLLWEVTKNPYNSLSILSGGEPSSGEYYQVQGIAVFNEYLDEEELYLKSTVSGKSIGYSRNAAEAITIKAVIYFEGEEKVERRILIWERVNP